MSGAVSSMVLSSSSGYPNGVSVVKTTLFESIIVGRFFRNLSTPLWRPTSGCVSNITFCNLSFSEGFVASFMPVVVCLVIIVTCGLLYATEITSSG